MTTNMDSPKEPRGRTTRRQRHPVVLRRLSVLCTAPLGPVMRRITLTGPDLDGFASPGFDDHVKIFFAAPGQDGPVLPQSGSDGLVFPETGPQPLGRDFTPRRYDPETRELDIDFALLHEGPASRWAAEAQPGDLAWVAGPRSSFLVPFEFDWHLLVADETGLPALARRLEELPASSWAVALIETDDGEPFVALARPSRAEIIWVSRGGERNGAAIVTALRGLTFPTGDCYAWIAAESAVAKSLRTVLIDERGADRRWVRAHGYWRQGTAAAHDDLDI